MLEKGSISHGVTCGLENRIFSKIEFFFKSNFWSKIDIAVKNYQKKLKQNFTKSWKKRVWRISSSDTLVTFIDNFHSASFPFICRNSLARSMLKSRFSISFSFTISRVLPSDPQKPQNGTQKKCFFLKNFWCKSKRNLQKNQKIS